MITVEYTEREHIQQWLDDATSASEVPDETFINGPEQGLATRLHLLCLHLLRCMYERERESTSRSQAATLKRELGRLYLWGESFAAGCLDRALEQSDGLRDTILGLLCAIGELLIRESLSPLDQPTERIQELELLVKQTRFILLNRDCEVKQHSNEIDEDRSPYTTELSDIEFFNTCLIELGPTLDRYVRCEDETRSQPFQPALASFGVSGAAYTYVSLIRDKFNQAPIQLVERLGEANWKRHEKVRRLIERLHEKSEEDPTPGGGVGGAISAYYPSSAFHDSGIGTSLPTQTQHNSHAQSHASLISTNAEGSTGVLRVPRGPAEIGATKFSKCSFCGNNVSNIRSRVEWKLHVFSDLKPYICTFSDCQEPFLEFSDRASWANHEFSKHRVDQFWDCPECHQEYTSASNWEQHLSSQHQLAFPASKLQVATNAARKAYARLPENEECPFCRETGKPRQEFVKHVGRHMEEIALMALPRGDSGDSEAKSASSGEDDMGSSKLNSLPALTRISSRFSQSVSDGMGESQMTRKMRILVRDYEGALEPTTLPPLRRPDQDPILECPFTFIKCFRQFTVANERAWIKHSLDHFRIGGKRPRIVDPPKVNSCCFCPRTFQALSGLDSWQERMDHVKVHHQYLGHRLVAARHDFALVDYFWQNGLLSKEDYRNLKASAGTA